MFSILECILSIMGCFLGCSLWGFLGGPLGRGVSLGGACLLLGQPAGGGLGLGVLPAWLGARALDDGVFGPHDVIIATSS